MAPSHKPLVADSLQFFFFPTNDGYGVLLERAYYQLLVKFEHARSTAGTWGELLEILGPNATEFVLTFTQCDERVAQASDSIDSLMDDVWVLCTEEFPFVQCAEESFSFHGDCFPEEGGLVAWTEYGEQFRFYPESSFLNLKRHLERGGHTLQVADPDQVHCPMRVTAPMRGKSEVSVLACIDLSAESGGLLPRAAVPTENIQPPDSSPQAENHNYNETWKKRGEVQN